MNSQSAASMPKTAYYCTGCNEVFVAGTDVCPQCSVQADPDIKAKLSDTLHLPKVIDPDATADALIKNKHIVQLNRLIGSQLHCYHIDSILGRGGMGHVFLAIHSDLQRKCAVKVLCPSLIEQNDEFVHRFANEAQASASLIHPNIVTTHAIGKSDGFHFLEMEYVPGRSLQKLVMEEGPVSAIRATALIARIAEGLAVAHQQQIVHRDLKPDNILMTPRGIPKIADFGLAKRVAASGKSAKHLAGTPYYMAPELFQGEEATPASDVYALGVCYFYLLTGQHPFTGANFSDLMTAAQTHEIPNVRKLTREVTFEMAECLNLMLAKSPNNRPRDAMAALHLLQAVLGAVRDIESMLQEAFGGHDFIKWTRVGKRYQLDLNLNDGRHQRVFVETSNHAPAEQLLMIYSICGDAKPEYHSEALRLNSEIPFGGLAIREVDGINRFIVVDNYPRGTVAGEEIRLSVMEVANQADRFEMRLHPGQDEF